MSDTNYPVALDTWVNPNAAAGDTLGSVPHDLQHRKVNDAIAAIQAKLGITSSLDVASIDYAIRHLQGLIAPTAHIADVGTAITTSGINVSLLTNYNLVSGVLGIANGLNDANTAQNQLGVAYMALAVITLDLINKFNTLIHGLQAQGLET